MSTTSYFLGGLKKVLLHTYVVTVPILLWPTVQTIPNLSVSLNVKLKVYPSVIALFTAKPLQQLKKVT